MLSLRIPWERVFRRGGISVATWGANERQDIWWTDTWPKKTARCEASSTFFSGEGTLVTLSRCSNFAYICTFKRLCLPVSMADLRITQCFVALSQRQKYKRKMDAFISSSTMLRSSIGFTHSTGSSKVPVSRLHRKITSDHAFLQHQRVVVCFSAAKNYCLALYVRSCQSVISQLSSVAQRSAIEHLCSDHCEILCGPAEGHLKRTEYSSYLHTKRRAGYAHALWNQFAGHANEWVISR